MKPGEQNEKGVINQILKHLIPGKEIGLAIKLKTEALLSFCSKASPPSLAVRDDFFEAKTHLLLLNSFCAVSPQNHTSSKLKLGDKPAHHQQNNIIFNYFKLFFS